MLQANVNTLQVSFDITATAGTGPYGLIPG